MHPWPILLLGAMVLAAPLPSAAKPSAHKTSASRKAERRHRHRARPAPAAETDSAAAPAEAEPAAATATPATRAAPATTAGTAAPAVRAAPAATARPATAPAGRAAASVVVTAPAAPAPAVALAPEPRVAPASDDGTLALSARPAARARDREHEIVDLAVAAKFGMRRFAYTDSLSANTDNYSLGGTVLFGVEARLFPFTTTRIPFLSDLGFEGSYTSSLAIQSAPVESGGQAATSMWREYTAGLRWRFHRGPAWAPRLGVALDYGELSFDFRNADAYAGALPDVRYRYLRPALDLRMRAGRFSATGAFGYRGLVSTGALGTRFPHASAHGIDAAFTASVRVVWNLEVYASAEYVRVFYALHPVPGDAYVAGGALDEYLVFHGGLALAY